jgi:heme/copper-type cytochrome/quinol oxidase subunit 1
MTMTETRPEEVADSAAPAASPAVSGLAGWLTTADHKRIGRLYVGFSLLFAIGLLGVGAVLAFEKVDAGSTQLVQLDSVFQTFSLYRWGFALGVVAPLVLGVCIAVVPLQLGVRSVAFPRAAALSFWGWLLGMGLLVGAFADNGGPAGGNSEAVDLFLVALGLIVVALLLGGLCVATTVLTLRVPGMTLQRVPMFAWAALAGLALLLVSLSVLLGELVLVYGDHRYGRVVFGGNLKVGEYIDWAIGPTQLYLLAIPVLGMVADIAATAAKVRQPMRGVLTGFIGLGAIMSVGAELQLAFNPNVRGEVTYIAATIGAALAVLAVTVVVAMTLVSRKTRVTGGMVAGVCGLLMILVGVLAGSLTGFERLDLVGATYATDSAFVLGIFNYVVLGALLAGMGSVAHWGPKLWGRKLADKVVIGLSVVGLIGVVLVAFPDLVSGFLDQPAYEVNFDVDGPHQLLNSLSAAGYVVVLLVVVAFVLLCLRGFTHGDAAGDDPWDGSTLEWATSSPPPPDNFAELATVRSAEPLFDKKEA